MVQSKTSAGVMRQGHLWIDGSRLANFAMSQLAQADMGWGTCKCLPSKADILSSIIGRALAAILVRFWGFLGDRPT
jgi:hypothetical protein